MVLSKLKKQQLHILKSQLERLGLKVKTKDSFIIASGFIKTLSDLQDLFEIKGNNSEIVLKNIVITKKSKPTYCKALFSFLARWN